MLGRFTEVGLSLNEISEQSAQEKSIRHGHIFTLHIWSARRPVAACRAVVFASPWAASRPWKEQLAEAEGRLF